MIGHATPEQLEAYLPYAVKAKEALLEEASKHDHRTLAYARVMTKAAILTRQIQNMTPPEAEGGNL